jgi:hypothetical protein
VRDARGEPKLAGSTDNLGRGACTSPPRGVLPMPMKPINKTDISTGQIWQVCDPYGYREDQHNTQGLFTYISPDPWKAGDLFIIKKEPGLYDATDDVRVCVHQCFRDEIFYVTPYWIINCCQRKDA